MDNIEYDLVMTDWGEIEPLDDHSTLARILNKLHQSKSLLTKQELEQLFLFLDERCKYRRISLPCDLYVYLNDCGKVIGPELSKALRLFEESCDKGMLGVWSRRNKKLEVTKDFLNSISIKSTKVYYPYLLQDLFLYVLDDTHRVSMKTFNKLGQVGKFFFSVRDNQTVFYDKDIIRIDPIFEKLLKEVVERTYAPSEKDLY